MVDPGKSANARRSDWSVFAIGVGVGLVVIALLAAAYAIGQNRGRAEALRAAPAAASAAPATTEAPAETESAPAAALFAQTCGGCHTLSAAGTSGTVGPNLDDLAPSVEQVLAAIENGGAGSGQMPAGLLQGDDARTVAELVSFAAGR